MKIYSVFLLTLLLNFKSFSQFKNDNVLYKTVYMSSLCDSLQKYPERIILDVRSPEEYNEETMQGMSGMNLGHFKNSININVQDLGKKLQTIEDYKNKAVFIICSHSQRSRRASALLAQNGFTNVLNINGGLSSIQQLPHEGNECIFDQISTKINYDLIPPIQFCREIISTPLPFILDVRPDSSNNHTSGSQLENSYGIFKSSKHIALSNLTTKLNEVPLNRRIIITDVTGAEAAMAAEILIKSKYNNVGILLGGIQGFISTASKFVPCKSEFYNSPVLYKIIGSADLYDIYTTLVNPLFIDIRAAAEFENKSKDNWKNIGHISGALNIPYEELALSINILEHNKNKTVVIYDFSGNNNIYAAAKELLKQGYKDIYVLSQGLFNLRWTANNIKEYNSLSTLIVNIPKDNF